MADLWGKDRLYSFLRPWVDYCTRGSYARLEMVGSLPDVDGSRAILIAPNHTNTIMDALVVLQCRRAPTVFGARADIFRNPTAAKVLRFLRIVPMVRARDGLRNVAKNRETMVEIDEVLEHGVPFCMFPEGRHRPRHSLLPLQKGIFRLAFESADKRPTVIVPVGIDYSEFFRYRGVCRITFGDPIDVNDYLAAHQEETELQQYEGLRSELAARMRKLIRWVPDDDIYQQRMLELPPLGTPRPQFTRILLATLLSPLFLVAAILALPMWLTSEIICHRIGDPAFRNSVRMLVKLLLTFPVVILWAVLGFIFLPWWGGVAVTVAAWMSYGFFYDWLLAIRRHQPE